MSKNAEGDSFDWIIGLISFGIVGLFIFFTDYDDKLLQWINGESGCVNYEDIELNESDNLYHLKSTGEVFNGIICHFRGDQKYLNGKRQGYHSSYYQEKDYGAWYEAFFYSFLHLFYKSGGRERRRYYEQGKLNGEYKKWDKYGNLTYSVVYQNDKKVGEERVLTDGEWQINEYKNGKLINNPPSPKPTSKPKPTPKINPESQLDLGKLDDAVVLINMYDFYGKKLGHGSGFIIDEDGTVVTNYHNIKVAYTMTVETEINDERYKYEVEKIISGDEFADLAKIKIKRKNSQPFKYLDLATTPPKKGDKCWAIGTPFSPEFMNTVSEGLVSNLRNNEYPQMIQTNAPFTHGSSGGPLLNSRGEVIGVTTLIVNDKEGDGARASINFATSIKALSGLIPINKKTVIDPNSIPAELTFYAVSSNVGSLYVIVDGVVLGAFKKYFNYTPSCGDNNTITRVLAPGYHQYEIYNENTRKSIYGEVTLEPGECHLRAISMR